MYRKEKKIKRIRPLGLINWQTGVPENMNRGNEGNKNIKEIIQDFLEQKAIHFQNESSHQVPSTVSKKSHRRTSS